MPKINPNQFKNYVAELRKERFGTPFGRKDQLCRQSTHSDESIQDAVLQETFQSCQSALQALNTIGTQLPRYRGALIELFTYDPTFGEMLRPNYNPCSDEPSQYTLSIVNSFIPSLTAVCKYYHRTIRRQQAGIDFISKSQQHSANRRMKPLLQKRLTALYKELLPLSRQLQWQFNQFNACLRKSYQAKQHNQSIDREGLMKVIHGVNAVWRALHQAGKVEDIFLS